MDLEKLAKDFGGFLGHYSGELRVISSTLQSVVDHLPIDHQDKERIGGILTGLQDAATRVATAAEALGGQTVDVTVAKADVEEAVTDYLDRHPGAASGHPERDHDAGNASAGGEA